MLPETEGSLEARGPRRFQEKGGEKGGAKRGQEQMGPALRGTFNNSLTFYAAGQELICSIWGDSNRFCYRIAGVLNKSSSRRPKAEFVILAVGGHGNRRRFGNAA